MRTIYSSTRSGGGGGGNRTRRNASGSNSGKKSRDITNIIKMLHDDMSGDDLGGSHTRDADHLRNLTRKQYARQARPSVEREGMVNFEDPNDMESDQYLRDSVNRTKSAFNYTQKARMEEERARLKYEADTQISSGSNMIYGPGSWSTVFEANKVSQDEIDYVSRVGDGMSSVQPVEGDQPGVFYADTRSQARHGFAPKAPKAPNAPNAPKGASSKRVAEEVPTTDAKMGTFAEYDHKNTETYIRPKFGRGGPEYEVDENQGFRYPRWSTRKNRRHGGNANLDDEEGEEDRERREVDPWRSPELKYLSKRLEYLIHMMEENEETKSSFVVEELILYCFLGFFVLFIVDSFTNVNVKYKRAL